MGANLKIDADFKNALSGFKELDKTVSTLSKKKYGLNIDNKVVKELSKDLKNTFKDLESNNKRLSKEINNLGKELEKATDPAKVKRLRDEIGKLTKDVGEAAKAMNGSSAAGGGFGGSGMGRGGRGGIGGMLGGLGKAGGMASVAAGAVTGMGALVMKALQPALIAAEGRLGLKRLGMSGAAISTAEQNGVTRYGQTYEQTRGLSQHLLRSTGSAGSVGGVQALSLLTGGAGEDISGMMGSMRRNGTDSKQSLKMLKDVYSEAVARGFDESRALDVMQTLADNVENLGAGGANAAVIKDLMMGLIGSSDFFKDDPKRAGQVLSTIENKFTSGGPAAALSYRTLRGMGGAYGQMSPMQLIEQTGLGLMGQGGAGKAGYNAYLGTVASQAIGRKVGVGDKLSEDERSTVSVAGFRDFMGLNPQAAKQLSYSFQNGDDKGIAKILEEANKTSEQKLLDLLNDPDKGLIGAAAALDAIKNELSSAMTPLLKGLDGNLSEILQGLKPIFETVGAAASGANSFMSNGGADFRPWNLVKRGWKGVFGGGADKFSYNGGGANAWQTMSGQKTSASTSKYGPIPGSMQAGLADLGMGGGNAFANSGPVDTSMLSFKSDSVRNGFNKMNPHSQSLAAWASKLTGIAQTITSGFRTEGENAAAGGAPHSGHLTGNDFDVRISNLSPAQIKALIEAYNSQSGVNASIHGGDHIHVSNRSGIKNKLIAGTSRMPSMVSGENIVPEEATVASDFVLEMKKNIDKGFVYPSPVLGFGGYRKMKN